MPRILELSPTALRSYGGSYVEYQQQRDAEQQAARAALEHVATERRRTRARQHKEHDDCQRRSAKTLRTVDALNIAFDLASVQAIEAALADFPGAMLVASHDEAFLQGLKLTHALEWHESGWHFSAL
jgi:ATPase subunit of ABC transporter with duplicated ATPase domains